jgi:hypothetical protein
LVRFAAQPHLKPVKEDAETLAELMLHADQFCSSVEAATKDVAPNPEQEELKTKLGQCRAQLAHLQNVFDEDKLKIENPAVRADFRHLVMALMWVAFYARTAIDFKTYRRLVMIESSFTYLLNCR